MRYHLLLAGLLATSCASTTPTPSPIVLPAKIIDNSCDWVRLVSVSSTDVLTAETVRQLRTHDKAVKANCPNVKTY